MKKENYMDEKLLVKIDTLFYWLPRLGAIVFTGFLAVFALDVFIPGKSAWAIAGALFMHLIPNYLLLITLLIAWKKEELGGFLFILLGISFTAFFQTYQFLPNFFLISFPIFTIGMLFLIHNVLPKK